MRKKFFRIGNGINNKSHLNYKTTKRKDNIWVVAILVFYKKSIVEYWSNYNYGDCLPGTEFMVKFLSSALWWASGLHCSDEKSPVNFWGSLICHIFLLLFWNFSVVIFNTFDYDTSRCDCILLGVKFLGCVFKTWKVSVIISSYFPIPFSGVMLIFLFLFFR